MHKKLRSWNIESRCVVRLRMRIMLAKAWCALWPLFVTARTYLAQRKLHSNRESGICTSCVVKKSILLYQSWSKELEKSLQDSSITYFISSRSCVSIDRKSISSAVHHGTVQDPEAGLHDERAAGLQARPEKSKRIISKSSVCVHVESHV